MDEFTFGFLSGCGATICLFGLWYLWRKLSWDDWLLGGACITFIAFCEMMDKYAPSWWFFAFLGLVMIALSAVLLWERIARRR